MKTLPFFSILLISITLAACKHDQYDVHGCGEFNSYEDVKAFGFFNNGTYWIYENQQTLERDTFTVFSLTIGYTDDEEVGFWTRMNRTQSTAEWEYYHNGNHNVFPPDNNCESRRVFMKSVYLNESGQAIDEEKSILKFPIMDGATYYAFCDGVNFDARQSNVRKENLLGFSNIPVFSIESKGFSLNPCTGETYRFQFGKGIGLVSWENLDAMDGKWELIEFERT
jgi:hypothetical protein